MALRTISKEELDAIVEQHKQWLLGNGGKQADLTSADLTSADLRYANLTSADLTSADLRYANLTSADLTSADLRYANLTYADLRSADLTSADLTSADLTYANLTSADLTSANLTYADLTYANLTSADLTSADLRYANLTSADLTSANLTSADLTSADLTSANLTYADLTSAKGHALAIAMTRVVPPEGDVTGWKQCQAGVLVKVKIPSEAKRSNAFGRKCRAEFVDVLEIVGGEVGVSKHDGKTEYKVGSRVACDSWCDDFTQECAGGIHFFITREEAEAY